MPREAAFLVVQATDVSAEGPAYWAGLHQLGTVGEALQAALDRIGGPGSRTVGPLNRSLKMRNGQWHWRLALRVPPAASELARDLARRTGVRYLPAPSPAYPEGNPRLGPD